MDKLKQYVVFTVLGCLVVLAAGWFLLVSPKRNDASALRTQADEQVQANAQLSTALTVLKAQAKALPKQQAKLAAVAAKIPDNPALPAMIRALTAAATASGVELVSITSGNPTFVALPAAAAPAAAPAAGAKAPAAAKTAAGGSSSAGQLASIPLTLNVVGGYFDVEQFVSKVESLPRSMRLTSLSVAPGANPVKPNADAASIDNGKSLLSVLTGEVYMAANRPRATAVTVPGQPVVGTGVTPVAPVTPVKK